jgi:hypothetical protein
MFLRLFSAESAERKRVESLSGPYHEALVGAQERNQVSERFFHIQDNNAISFAEEQINLSSRELEILKTMLAKGRYYTVLPADLSEMPDLHQGGLFQKNKSTCRTLVTTRLQSVVDNSDKLLCASQNMHFKPGDPAFKESETYMSVEDAVFYFTRNVADAIALSSNYPRVILLGEVSRRQCRLSFMLGELLRNIHTIMFGAFDDECFLVWSRANL